jgi:hypothetical protein
VRLDDRVGALGIADGRVVTAVFGEEEPLLALGAIFALDGAEFEFTPWDDAPPANLEGKTLADLLRQADAAKKAAEEARRKAEEEREAARRKAEEEAEAERQRIAALRAVIPSDDLKFRLSERAVDQGAVTLTSERWRLVLAVNGERDLNGIASTLHMDHDATLTALVGLVNDRVIETVAPTAPAAHEAPTYESSAASLPTFEPAAPTYEPPTPTQDTETASFAPSGDPFAPPPEEVNQFMPQPEAPAAETAPPQDWITPDQVAPEPDWTTTTPTESAPVSEVAPQWGPASEAPVAPPDWVTPEAAEASPPSDDRLSALSEIFGPAPSEPKAPAPEPPHSWTPPATSDGWGTPAQPAPTAERWSGPRPEPARSTSDDPWGAAPPTAPTESAPWVPSADKSDDSWVAPAPAQPRTWSPPTGGNTSADPWGSPAGSDPRVSALSIPEPGTPPVEEWSPPPGQPMEKKKRGLFGFGREKPAPPVAGMPLPTAEVVGSRVGMLAALANTLIAEYNNGQYGKGRIEERIANLLMRVDEQADPIDRPLPIVDDRIDVETLEREHVADSQALPYLALLVTTIFADAEKAFGKDKAKKGYKAAQKSVLLGDASALNSPELAGKLPRV